MRRCRPGIEEVRGPPPVMSQPTAIRPGVVSSRSFSISARSSTTVLATEIASPSTRPARAPITKPSSAGAVNTKPMNWANLGGRASSNSVGAPIRGQMKRAKICAHNDQWKLTNAVNAKTAT